MIHTTMWFETQIVLTSPHKKIAMEKVGLWGIDILMVLSNFQRKKNFGYTVNNSLKRASSGGVHLRDFAPGQHTSEETS